MKRLFKAIAALFGSPLEFLRGAYEFRRGFTESGAGNGYEWGREAAHVLTLRRYED